MENDLSVLGRIAKDPVAGRLSHAHLQALGHVVAHPDAATPSLVAKGIGMTKGAASRVVGRLVAEKLVTSRRDTEDTRVVLLAATAAGRKLHARVVAMLQGGA